MPELESLLDTAKARGYGAVVLCPNNDPGDARPQEQRAAETIEALVAFGPMFAGTGVLGLVEPLGFAISSLASLVLAQPFIRQSGFDCYRMVHDTFHFHIGPEDHTIFGAGYDVSGTGLVHLSGVEADIPASACRPACIRRRLDESAGDFAQPNSERRMLRATKKEKKA